MMGGHEDNDRALAGRHQASAARAFGSKELLILAARPSISALPLPQDGDDVGPQGPERPGHQDPYPDQFGDGQRRYELENRVGDEHLNLDNFKPRVGGELIDPLLRVRFVMRLKYIVLLPSIQKADQL